MGVIDIGFGKAFPTADPAFGIRVHEYSRMLSLAMEEWSCNVRGCGGQADRTTYHPNTHALACVWGHPGSLAAVFSDVIRRVERANSGGRR